MKYKYTLPKERSFALFDLSGYTYSGFGENQNVDAHKIIAHGWSGDAETGNYDRVYLLLSGVLDFKIDEQEFRVSEGEVVILPKNTKYSYSGDAEIFEVNSPAFRL